MVPVPRSTFSLFLFLVAALALSAAPLRVGIDTDGEPMTFLDAKGVPSGFAVDLMNAIASEMKMEVTYVAKPWAEMMEDFRAGRTDALANITFTAERARFIDFTDPHVVMSAAIFVRKGDTTIKTLADLRTQRVAVKLSGAPHAYLVAHGWDAGVFPAPTLRDSLRAVSERRADAALDASIIGSKLLHDERMTNVEIADVSVRDFAQRLHIGLQPGHAAQVALINDGLARVRANGTYDRIYEKWLAPLEPQRVRWRQLRPYLLPATLILALMAGAFLRQRHLLTRLARQASDLRRSQEQLTLVMEGSEDGFWDWDVRTDRVERSERWASMLGFTLAEIPQRLSHGSELVHPDDREIVWALNAQRLSGSQLSSHAEFRMRTKSGEWRWILNRGKVVARAPDGRPLRMAGTHTDVTDLRQARDALIRQEAMLRFIFENSPVGLSWLKHGDESSRVVNPAHERITGVPAEKSRVPNCYFAATHYEDALRQRGLEERLVAREIDHFSLEKRYVHPNGDTVWALLTMHLHVDPVTGELQQLTTLVDIDELKRTETERESLRLKMLETQKLESLGVLAGGIAHDFNNLLTVILGNATLERDESQEVDNRLVQIEAAARRASDLCRQMLAYAGRGNFLVQRLELGDLVRDTAELLSVSISKKIDVTLALAPGLPPVNADPSQLRQVVMNLVINASEAQHDQSGQIAISTRLGRPGDRSSSLVHAFDLPAGDCVCLEVSDRGHGMSPVTLARIFDPFFTTKFAGRGLGLAAVLGIVRAHRGALAVDSEVGRGTTFRLFLPVSPTPGPVLPSAGTRAPFTPATGGTVLIADDEPAVLAAANLILRRNGYQTITARDGKEAVQLFHENRGRIDASLLDLTMPELDGAEVLRAIRAVQPDARILVMSGYSEQDVMMRLQGLGEVSILRKPFTHDALLSRIAAVIGSRDRLS